MIDLQGMEVVMKKVFYILAAMFFAFMGIAYAEYYTWEDEHGVTQITDYPPPETQKVNKLQQYKTDEPSADQAAKAPSKLTITLYTKNECADCDKARSFLEDGGYLFTEHNMDTDRNAAEIRKAIDESDDVPLVIINTQRIYGFSESVYSRALKRNP